MSWLRPIDRWFADHVLPHEAHLLDQARRWAADEQEARDLVHDAYARMLALDGWAQIANPAAYAMRIVRNAALERMRRARIVPIRQLAAVEAFDQPDPAPDGFDVAAGRDELARLRAAIDALPPACRRVILMRKFEGLPPREIAARLGLSLSTVEKHLARGLLLLGRAIGRNREAEPIPGISPAGKPVRRLA